MALRKAKQNTLRFAGNFLLSAAANALCKTLNITFINKNVIDEFERKNQNYVLAFWHGTMLLSWYIGKDKKMAALISKSKDGKLLAKILRSWNYTVVRGSSSKGGEVALGVMVDYAKNNNSIAVTPDGPRGPMFKMKAGAVVTAKKSKVPLVLLGVGYKRKKVLDSWDKFQVPHFFTKAKAVFSEPVYISSSLSREETSKIIQECEDRLNELQREAEIF